MPTKAMRCRRAGFVDVFCSGKFQIRFQQVIMQVFAGMPNQVLSFFRLIVIDQPPDKVH